MCFVNDKEKKSKKKLFKFILFISSLILLFLVLFIGYKLGYRYNSSASFPIGIYKLDTSKKEIYKGKMVLFCPPNTKIFKQANKYEYVANGICSNGYRPMIKKIAAIHGDIVKISDFVYINNIKQKNSNVYNYDPGGRMLYHQKEKILKLQKNDIFVLSDYNKRSFDSRYFGIISSELVQGELKPVLLF